MAKLGHADNGIVENELRKASGSSHGFGPFVGDDLTLENEKRNRSIPKTPGTPGTLNLKPPTIKTALARLHRHRTQSRVRMGAAALA